MIDEKVIELIDREIDGINSGEESTKLKAYLAENSEARAYYEEHTKLAKMLAQIENIDPPANLKKNILNSVPAPRYVKKGTKSFWQTFQQALRGKRNYKYAFMFSAGLATGLLFFVLVSNLGKSDALNVSDLTGTILLQDVSETFRTVDQLKFDVDGARGHLVIKTTNDLFLLANRVESDGRVELLFEFDREKMGLVGVRQSGDSAEFLAEAGTIKLTNIGTNQYWIVFRKRGSGASSIRFRILKNSVSLFEGNLSLGNPVD